MKWGKIGNHWCSILCPTTSLRRAKEENC